jgi:hypothetical protein
LLHGSAALRSFPRLNAFMNEYDLYFSLLQFHYGPRSWLEDYRARAGSIMQSGPEFLFAYVVFGVVFIQKVMHTVLSLPEEKNRSHLSIKLLSTDFGHNEVQIE